MRTERLLGVIGAWSCAERVARLDSLRGYGFATGAACAYSGEETLWRI
jgi:hypothetical protein